MTGITGSESFDIARYSRDLYIRFGQNKRMGVPAVTIEEPKYFLIREMFGDNDLLIIFFSKRCRYQCHFCQLPSSSYHDLVPEAAIIAQFKSVLSECKNALSIIERFTLSNDGSILDSDTFPESALSDIFKAIGQLKRTTRIVLETGLEFIDPQYLKTLNKLVPRVKLDILTGFETFDESIRYKILGKRESISDFMVGVRKICQIPNATLTCYVLYKPDPVMTDEDAMREATRSIEFLVNECRALGLGLEIRINPMYAARGSIWARAAEGSSYMPPRLSDVLELAQKVERSGTPTYIGLSSESLARDKSSYAAREDYSAALLLRAIEFNRRHRLNYT